MLKNLSVFLLLFVTILAQNLWAQNPKNHMIELGSGIESGVENNGVNILLRVGYGYVKKDEGSPIPDDRDLLGQERLILAKITGDFAFNPQSESSGDVLPYLNIDFIPLQNQLRVVTEAHTAVLGTLNLLPMNFGRNIRLDQNFKLQVDVIGVKFNFAWEQQKEKIVLLANLALNAIGYKYVNHYNQMKPFMEETVDFHGFHLGDLSAGLGAFFNIAPEKFTLTVMIGGETGISFGGKVGSGYTAQSDMEAYFLLQASIYKFVEIYFKGGVLGAFEPSRDASYSTPQIMTGVNFKFEF